MYFVNFDRLNIFAFFNYSRNIEKMLTKVKLLLIYNFGHKGLKYDVSIVILHFLFI